MHRKRKGPTVAGILEQVQDLLRQAAILTAGEKVIVAVSGGVDSMVLLDVMERLSRKLEVELHLAHLDHQLRPDSAADADFVEEVARQRGLACTRGRVDVALCARQQGMSLEEAGRWLRYQFFDQVALEQGSEKIALGHHAGDQAETLLLRLLRGSGTGGLGAMEVVREGRYLRPLLGCQRSAIEAYARAGCIEFREDISNQDLRFVRNRIRGELIPYLQQHYNANIIQVLGRTAQILKDEDRFLVELVGEALSAAVCERDARKIILDVEQFLNYHIAIQRRIVKTLLQGLSEQEGPFDFVRIEAVLALLKQGSGSGVHQIGSGLRAQHAGNRFIFYKGHPSPVDLEVRIPGAIRIPSHGLSVTARLLPVRVFPKLKSSLGKGRAAFDADLVGTHLQVRSPRPGDRFQPLGMEGHKKLSDFLIDHKWPRILRDEVLLLARDDEIVWVAGLRPDHRFRISGATKKIALVELSQTD